MNAKSHYRIIHRIGILKNHLRGKKHVNASFYAIFNPTNFDEASATCQGQYQV